MWLLVAFLAAVFTALSLWVVFGSPAAFDLAGVHFLQSISSRTLDEVVGYFTLFGSTPAVFLIIPVTALLVYRRDRRLALAVVAVGVAVEVSYPLFKLAFQRDRPRDLATFFLPTTFSFPSGHATAAVAVYGILAYAIARLHPRLRMPLAIITPIFAILLGLSRPYLGVHWPTDVLAGFALGALILIAGIRYSKV